KILPILSEHRRDCRPTSRSKYAPAGGFGVYEQSETGCCPRFDSGPWEDKEIKFKDKLFLKDHVRSFLHIPLNFDKIIAKNME
ncbi:MAG: hypothetical protein QSU88_05650, partial [Candidatus Methanoperedens sp.]|nr:hypothetical protein [Candidatus Methanoperedens sp.]